MGGPQKRGARGREKRERVTCGGLFLTSATEVGAWRSEANAKREGRRLHQSVWAGGGTGPGRQILHHLLDVCLEIVFYSVFMKFADRLGDTFIPVHHHCFIDWSSLFAIYSRYLDRLEAWLKVRTTVNEDQSFCCSLYFFFLFNLGDNSWVTWSQNLSVCMRFAWSLGLLGSLQRNMHIMRTANSN